VAWCGVVWRGVVWCGVVCRFIGFSVLPILSIREGFRRVTVYNEDGRTDAEHEFTTLFAHFEFSHDIHR
jgi:hypothetical protein